MLLNDRQINLVRSFLLLLVIGSVAACGFRLRGEIEIPPELKETRIIGPAEFAPLALEFKRVLTRAGSSVLSSTATTSSTIIIEGERFTKRVLTVDALGRVAEYELIYSYAFKIVTSEKVELVPTQKIEFTRDYRFDPDNVLAIETEEARIRSEMVRFSVVQAMRRINAILKSKSGT